MGSNLAVDKQNQEPLPGIGLDLTKEEWVLASRPAELDAILQSGTRLASRTRTFRVASMLTRNGFVLTHGQVAVTLHNAP